MPTNLHIDEKLLKQAMKLGGKKTKRETVNAALEEYVRQRRVEEFLALAGTVEFDPAYDRKFESRAQRPGANRRKAS